jgi:hypothetical protein
MAPGEMLRLFALRWQMEVTFAEVRKHLGVETQRQWSDLAIARATPMLLGLFSLVAWWAATTPGVAVATLPTAWYRYLVRKAGRLLLADGRDYAGACCRMRSGSQGTVSASGILRRAPR